MLPMVPLLGALLLGLLDREEVSTRRTCLPTKLRPCTTHASWSFRAMYTS